jgi:heme A synthase
MAARRPRHRRWLVRRRRFLDAQGGQVTDTWLNIPLLPRRMVTWRSPDRSQWEVQFSRPPVGHGVFLIVLLLVALVLDISRDVGTGQWVASIPGYLIILVGLGILTVMTWQATHRPE